MSTKTLCVYDFDQTMLHTPGPPPFLNGFEVRDFWHSPESLGDHLIPRTPGKNWFVRPVIESFREDRKDPNKLVVVVTGRSEKMRGRISEILKGADLVPHQFHLKPDSGFDTHDYKVVTLHRLLMENPEIRHVRCFEDRKKHLQSFHEHARMWGYSFEPHLITEANSGRAWERFLELFGENLGMLAHRLSRFPSLRDMVFDQFRDWNDQGRPRRFKVKVPKTIELEKTESDEDTQRRIHKAHRKAQEQGSSSVEREMEMHKTFRRMRELEKKVLLKFREKNPLPPPEEEPKPRRRSENADERLREIRRQVRRQMRRDREREQERARQTFVDAFSESISAPIFTPEDVSRLLGISAPEKSKVTISPPKKKRRKKKSRAARKKAK